MSDKIREALLALADRIEEANEQPIPVARAAADYLRAALAQQPAPVTVPDDLRARCAEIIGWQKSGVLTGDALRGYARAQWYADEHNSLQMAEADTARQAYALIAAAPAAPIQADHTDLMNELYQILSAHNASEEVLDQIQAAIAGEPLPHASLLPYEAPADAEQDGTVRIPVETLQHIHRDLDACQKVIWLAGCRPRGYGFDPAYVSEAQARLKEIEALLGKEGEA
jgi:hypothetical protein